MSYVLTPDALKRALDIIRSLKEYPTLQYDESDYQRTKAFLDSPELARYLPPISRHSPPALPPTTSDGNYMLTSREGQRLIVPLDLSPLVELCCVRFAYAASPDSLNYELLERLFSYIEPIVRRILGSKESLYKQTSKILKDADQIYDYLRKRIAAIQDEYNDDSLFDCVFFLPDLFVYLCRLLADPTVPKEWKVECALAIVYLVSPIDVIPEAFIPHPIAYVDDMGIVLLALKRAFEGGYIERGHIEKHWPGRISSIDNMLEWLAAVEEVLGKRQMMLIWRDFTRKIFGTGWEAPEPA